MTEAALAAFMDAALAAQAAAAARTQTLEAEVDLGPVRVRVRSAGEAIHRRLTDMLVLADSAADDPRPVVEIAAFDSATSGVAMPAPPWGPDAYRPGLEIEGLRHGRFLASYVLEFSTLTVYDRQRRRGLYWALNAPALWACQEAAPLRNGLRWIAMDHGANLVHAAAVGDGDDGVLLLGATGAGKSTTSLACLLEGLTFVADDFCGLRRDGDGALRATPLTHTARATDGTLSLLPALRERIVNHGAPADHKAEIDVSDRLASGLRVRALCTPVRAPVTAPARRVARTAFVRSVLAGTVGGFPGLARETLEFLGRLAAELPCYELPIGPDLRGAGDVVSAVAVAPEAVAA